MQILSDILTKMQAFFIILRTTKLKIFMSHYGDNPALKKIIKIASIQPKLASNILILFWCEKVLPVENQ